MIHPRKEAEDRLSANSIFGGAKATQEADNVLLLQEEIITERVKRKFVEVVKNRFSGDLGQVPLIFNPLTTTFSKKYAKSKTKKTNAPTDNNSASVQDETDSWNSTYLIRLFFKIYTHYRNDRNWASMSHVSWIFLFYLFQIMLKNKRLVIHT